MFAALKSAFGAGAREVAANRGETKDFLEGVCAAAALVAQADGDLEETERAKVVSLLTRHPTLGKLYNQQTIQQTADAMFSRSKDETGRNQLGRELKEVRGRPDAQQMAEDIYTTAKDVAKADGQIEPEEEAMLKKIASTMGIDPASFEF